MDSVYTSYVFSIAVQLILLVILAYNTNIKVPPELEVLREAFRFEYYVSIIEFVGYLLIGYMLLYKKSVTVYRYADWFFTTSILLISLSYVFLYRLYKEKDKTKELTNEYIFTKYRPILQSLFLSNFFMLLFGFLGEMKKIPYWIGYILGMICFIITFTTLSNNFVKENKANDDLFTIFMLIWLFYGFAYLMPYKSKNMFYNLLDLVSKNMFGLYILYIIQQEKQTIN
jgi:bacteriorhodopsin